jgi:hypothetical protein
MKLIFSWINIALGMKGYRKLEKTEVENENRKPIMFIFI